MNRLYVVESTYSLTGAAADHRLALPCKDIAAAGEVDWPMKSKAWLSGRPYAASKTCLHPGCRRRTCWPIVGGGFVIAGAASLPRCIPGVRR